MWGLSKVDRERRILSRETGPFAAVVRLYSGRLLPCTVLNVSETGAKLGLVRDINLPKQFELSIPAKNALWRVRVVWQQGKQLGVCRV
jgi:hypothetical protein